MNAAIYARKSTDQPGVSQEAKSVGVQIIQATEFIAKMGWTLSEAHIYSDDDISGAEFERRPGFQQMMAAAKGKAFQVLVIRELSRLGRESAETQYTVKILDMAGVQIVDIHGASLTPKNWKDKALQGFQAAADEAHREDTSQKVIQVFTHKVKAGHVVGGRIFGYRNRDVIIGEDAHGRPLRSHVERIVDPIESPVVLRIFELFDSGLGLKRISKILMQEGAVTPKPFIRKDQTKVLPVQGWSPSTVGAILAREMYNGVTVWNRSQKRPQQAWGQTRQQPRPEGEWMRIPAEHLRIVPPDLWQRCAARRQDTAGRTLRHDSGRLCGAAPKRPTQNLLAGLSLCALCGGGLIVETSPRKRGRIPEYVCSRRRLNGTCSNALRLPAADVNEAVLRAIEEHALTPDAIEQVIHLSERDDMTELQDTLARESKDIEKRISRLVAAIETGGDAASLVGKIRDLEKRKAEIAVQSASLHPIPRLAPQVIEDRLAEWRRLLRGSTTQGRAVLQRILRGRLTFTPRQNPLTGEPDGYDFHGDTRYDKLFSGIAVETPPWIKASKSRRGFEDTTPEDTFDGDYGRLLAQAAQKVSGKGAIASGTPILSATMGASSYARSSRRP